MVEVMKKAVALGVAGAAAIVVAGWRRIQRDNTLEGDLIGDPATAWQPTEPAKPAEPDKPAAPSGPEVSESSSKAELYEIAQDLDIEGRSKMTKTELLAAIRNAS